MVTLQRAFWQWFNILCNVILNVNPIRSWVYGWKKLVACLEEEHMADIGPWENGLFKKLILSFFTDFVNYTYVVNKFGKTTNTVLRYTQFMSDTVCRVLSKFHQIQQELLPISYNLWYTQDNLKLQILHILLSSMVSNVSIWHLIQSSLL